MNKSLLSLLISIVFSCLCISCEEEEVFRFPSKTEISADGESVDIKSTNDMPPFIQQI